MQATEELHSPETSQYQAFRRRPGDLFRSMAALYLAKNPRCSRESLAEKIRRQLDTKGVTYHRRTIRRYLRGDVPTIPPGLEAAMRRLLFRTTSLSSPEAIEKALRSAGLHVPRSARVSQRVDVRRLVPPTRLWLHLHPDKTKRYLARKLSTALQRRGISVGVDSLQSSLAGIGVHVRREVLAQLISALREHGITSEAGALERYEAQASQIEASLEGREYVSAVNAQRLVDLWLMHSRGRSKRQLALSLRTRLVDQGARLGLPHLQSVVGGTTTVVQRRVLAALEALVRERLPPRKSLEQALTELSTTPSALRDLRWIRSKHLVQMAEQWLEEHPESSKRKLSARIAARARDMGFETSHNTIQAVLAGRPHKARRYLYRAMRSELGLEMREPSVITELPRVSP